MKILFGMKNDRNMTEPIPLMLLSAMAKLRGWETRLIILERDDVVDAVRDYKPDIVAFSAITGSHQAYNEAAARVKRVAPSIKTVLGGPYATFHPSVIHEHPYDAVGVGECDEAWPQLLEAWENGRSPDGIPNIVTPENAALVLRRSLIGNDWTIESDHLRPRLTDLDSLPFLDRALGYEGTAFMHRRKRVMMAGRGCPFRCTYCFEHAWNEMYRGKGKVTQRHSVWRICEELVQLMRDYDTAFIKFYDDVFPVFDPDGAWLEEFAETYPRMVGLPFHCLVRAELVNEGNERKLRLLKKAGIASITMSIEAGNPFSRDYVLIRDMTEEDLRKSFAICRRLNIPVFANTILGVPVPTLPDVNAPKAEYDGQLSRVLSVAAEVDPKRAQRTKKLAECVDEAQASSADETKKRRAVDRVLRGFGVLETQIEYDRYSVWENVRLGVSHGEFPVFFPYQTQLGAYAVRHGYFDGNYDTLHESYQTGSPLDCFTPSDKLQQQNLALLGTVVLVFAGSRNPVIHSLARPATWLSVDVLAKLPLTRLYVAAYILAKHHTHTTRLYPWKRTWSEWIGYLLENVSLDGIKQLKASSSSLFRIFDRRAA